MSEFRAMQSRAGGVDRAIAAIARRQWGVISVRQLMAIGLDKDQILYRARAGRLHRLHRGVYAVGHEARSFRGRGMAAVLACGGGPGAVDGDRNTVLDHWGAAVSHRSAAVLWGLLPWNDGPTHVSVPGDGGRARRAGIRLHRSLSLLPADVTLREGIPVTTPARTIADLRQATAVRRLGALSERELRRAIRQAEVLGLPIGDEVQTDRSRSDLESDFLGICRRHRLPPPEVNVFVGRDLVDFLWRGSRLIVETDSYLYHRGRAAFQDDRERDLRLRAAGFDVMRISEKQVDEEPDRVAKAVAAALRVGADAGQGR